MNGYMGQIKGPFSAGEELFNKIKSNCVANMKSIAHLGIQTEVSKFVYINDEEIEIGKTGIYEVRDTDITSIKFKTDVDENTIIDYVINISEDE